MQHEGKDTAELTLMRGWVTTAVEGIISSRLENGRIPPMASLRRLRHMAAEQLAEALSGLVADGSLAEHPTINDTLYEFTDKAKTDMT